MKKINNMIKKDLLKGFFLISLLFYLCLNIVAQQQQDIFINRSFQGVNLGISKSEFEKIAKEKNFTVQGELDIYFNQPEKNAIAIIFPPYFRKIIFYFYQDKLSMILFFFDSRYITIYEEYSRLYSKYGSCTVNQKQFIWEDSLTILILEKDPFIVKLIDKNFIQQLMQENQNIENIIQQSLENSLDTL